MDESNRSGKMLEGLIIGEFKSRGIPVFDDSDKLYNSDWISDRFVVLHAPYTSIYGSDSRTEILYRDCLTGREIRIECRWQQEPGSVDEKYAYFYLNAVQQMPEKEIWFVFGGEGARAGAVAWLKRECAKVAAKQIRVLSIAEARGLIKGLAA